MNKFTLLVFACLGALPALSQNCGSYAFNPLTHKLDCLGGATTTLLPDPVSFTAQSTVTITHNLGTLLPFVVCYGGGHWIIPYDVQPLDINTVVLTFVPAATATCAIATGAAGGSGGGGSGGGIARSSGAGSPNDAGRTCVAGQEIYLDTDAAEWWECDAANHWKRILAVIPTDQLAITGTIGTAPAAPGANLMTIYYDSADHRLHSVDETNLNVGYIGANLGIVNLSFPGPSVLSLKNTVGSHAMTIGAGTTRNAIGITDGMRFLCEDYATIDNQNGPTCFEIYSNPSAVNHISVQAASTGANPLLACSGSDTNVGCEIGVQGTGWLEVNNGNSCSTAFNCRDLKARHTLGGGTAPTLTAGTGTIAGTDEAGRVTLTAGSQTTITITFATTYTTNIPICSANDETTAAKNPITPQPTLTTLVLTATGTFGATDKISWLCRGY